MQFINDHQYPIPISENVLYLGPVKIPCEEWVYPGPFVPSEVDGDLFIENVEVTHPKISVKKVKLKKKKLKVLITVTNNLLKNV